MAMHAESSPLEQLTSLLAEKAAKAEEQHEQLTVLRAKTLATGIMLDELAGTPVGPPPRRKGVEVMLAAPDIEWVYSVKTRLGDALAGVDIELFGIPETPPRLPFRVQCVVSHVPGRNPTNRVRTALEQLGDLEVKYSRALDLIVVSPRG